MNLGMNALLFFVFYSIHAITPWLFESYRASCLYVTTQSVFSDVRTRALGRSSLFVGTEVSAPLITYPELRNGP